VRTLNVSQLEHLLAELRNKYPKNGKAAICIDCETIELDGESCVCDWDE